MIRNALVVSGGGSKIAFGAGVLWHLIQHEHRWWDVMTGVSSGSITIGALAQAKNKPELKWQIGRLRNYLLESNGDKSFYSGGSILKQRFCNIVKATSSKERRYGLNGKTFQKWKTNHCNKGE